MHDPPYKPIDCSIYDELEVLAMRRATCKIEFRVQSTDNEIVESRIVDVFARSGEEFIRLEDDREIRLDRIDRINRRTIRRDDPIGGRASGFRPQA